MKLEQTIDKIDLREQILAEWVLHRIEDLKVVDPDRALEIEAQVFTDEIIAHMVDHFDILLLTQLFKTLSPARFTSTAGVLEKMIAKWPEWQGREGSLAAPLICQNDPHAGAQMLRDYCQFPASRFTHPLRWKGVLEGIACLPPDQGAPIANQLVDRCLSDESEIQSFYEAHQTDVFKLAWRQNHPQTQSILKRITLLAVTPDIYQYVDALAAVLDGVGLGDIEYAMLNDMLDDEWPLDDEAFRFYYDDAIPYAEIKTILEQFDRMNYDSIHAFFTKHQDKIKQDRIKNACGPLINDKKGMERIRRKDQHPYFYNMILALLMASMRKTQFDLTGVTVERAIRFLLLDIKRNPAEKELTDFLKQQDRAKVTRRLEGVYAKAITGFHSDAHLVRLMGALQYDELLPLLTRALNEKQDFDDYNDLEEEPVPDMIEKALARYGERAVVYITTHFDSITDETAQYCALEIARQVDGESGQRFVNQYFDLYWRMEREFLLMALEAFADEKYLQRLKPYINKGQNVIDEAYLTIALINQRSDGELSAFLEKYKHKRKKQVDSIGEVFESALAKMEPMPYINAELECQNCHNRFVYQLKKVFVSEGARPYISEEIECMGCGKQVDFEFTKKGLMAVAGQLMAAKFRKEKGEQDLFGDGPLQYVPPPVEGQDMDVEDALDFHKRAIEKDPRNAVPYIQLAVFLQHLGRIQEANQYYEQAAAIDPAYIQAYYMPAGEADKEGDADAALQLLKQGVAYIKDNSFKYTPIAEIAKRDFARAYCLTYNDLIHRTGADAPPLEPPAEHTAAARQTQPYVRKRKIGRNEPCPCGSGKKYKKCCIDK